jgi:hypothetical protein
MFFKRKPVCFHEWRVVDFGYWGVSSEDYDGYYEIGCEKCGNKRTTNEHSFESMKERGLIKEASE